MEERLEEPMEFLMPHNKHENELTLIKAAELLEDYHEMGTAKEIKESFIKYIKHVKESKAELEQAYLKLDKLKRLVLLVDPVVSSHQVGETQTTQWDNFINTFPEEKDRENTWTKSER